MKARMKSMIIILPIVALLIGFAGGSVATGSDYWQTIRAEVDRVVLVIDGQKIDTPTILWNGVTYVPLRAVSESLSCSTNWIQETYTVSISKNNIIEGAVSNNNASTTITSESYKYPLHLYSNDGKTYLGKLVTNELAEDGIWNDFSTYGNKFNAKSIWNEFGTYGSDFSSESAFNKFATSPPKIVDDNGKFFGYLTANEVTVDGYTIEEIYQYLKDKDQ